MKVYEKPLFDSSFPLFQKFKFSSNFFQMIKITLNPSKSSMEEKKST
jgi:hypothetical protein